MFNPDYGRQNYWFKSVSPDSFNQDFMKVAKVLKHKTRIYIDYYGLNLEPSGWRELVEGMG